MRKREFVASLLATVASPAMAQVAANRSTSGSALLTISGGAIAKTNRGPFDPVSDVLMSKHKLASTSAYALDWAAIQYYAGLLNSLGRTDCEIEPVLTALERP